MRKLTAKQEEVTGSRFCCMLLICCSFLPIVDTVGGLPRSPLVHPYQFCAPSPLLPLHFLYFWGLNF